MRARLTIVAVIAIGALSTLAYLRSPGVPRTAWNALNDADRYELLSLNPHLSKPDYYGHEILGQTLVQAPSVRERLNNTLKAGARSSDGRAYACFNPRHGIRVTHADVVTDLLICFECRQVQVWRGGQKIAYFLVSESPQPVFDEVLKSAGVPLAPKEP